MSIITRKLLTRGVKLLIQHFTTPIVDVASQLTAATVGRDNLLDKDGRFSVSLHVPYLGGEYFSERLVTSQKVDSFCIPFTLPPLQEHFSSLGRLEASTPIPILEEVHVSFNTRDEPAAICDRSHVYNATTGHEGKLAYTSLDFYNLRVSLEEKSQWGFLGTAAPLTPEREIFAMNLPAAAFLSRTFRPNPFVLTGMSKPMVPYKSYLLKIDAQKLARQVMAAQTPSMALVSLTIRMVMRTPLLARDTSANWTQNLPTSHNGQKTADVLSITVPPSGSLVTETTLHTQPSKLDDVLLNGLRGGYGSDSDVPVSEHLQHDACYDVISVPMWANFGDRRVANVQLGYGSVTQMPYLGAAPHLLPTCDERIIDLPYPFTVHHVIASVSHARPPTTAPYSVNAAGIEPTLDSTFHRVGVALLSRGDRWALQQVAHGSWSYGALGTIPASLIDQIKHRVDGNLTASDRDFLLMQVPLVLDTNEPFGVGYGGVQGKPFFCGRATTKTAQSLPLGTVARSNVGSIGGGAGIASAVRGQEQALVVRWELHDAVVGLTGAAQTPESNFIGYGGNWVYIIGKKHLAAPTGNVPIF